MGKHASVREEGMPRQLVKVGQISSRNITVMSIMENILAK
jgi:hypothetical protein